MKVGVYILLLFFLFFSCKQVETGHVTVIHLRPNEKSILKVSDYFNRVEAVLLRDTFFFGVEDFIEGADKYIVLASDHPGLMQGKDRYYVFDKEGYFRNCIGTVGRGTGEYREIRNGLQMGEDSLLKIIDINKYLSYSLDGKVMQESALFSAENKTPIHTSPRYLWKDSLVVFEGYSVVTDNPAMLRAAKQDSSCFCEIYALKRNELIHSYFPKKEAAEFYVTNLEYVYQDTFCYYYGLDRTIYQLLPGEKKVRYRFDMGKYNRLQTMIDFYEEQKSGVLHEYLSLSMCNETDGYVIGKYDFKAKEYIFIYDKRTGITGNFRRIDNDLLKTGQKNGAKYFTWKRGLVFKQGYLWGVYSYDWIEMIDQVKSQLSAEEWKTYCEEHPDFIRIYDILVKDKRNKDSEDYQGEDDDEKVVILKYYFK